MSGNHAGGIKARQANLKKNPNHYREIGAKGGSVKVATKGFGSDKERARTAGTKGGKKSRRKSYALNFKCIFFDHNWDKLHGYDNLTSPRAICLRCNKHYAH